MSRRPEFEDVELKEIVAMLSAGSESSLMLVVRQGNDEDGSWIEPLSRLEIKGVLLDESASLALPEPYRSEMIGFIPGVRREGKPFRAYRLSGAKQGAAGLQPARADLWTELLEKLDSPDGGGSWIGLCGDPGSGKSFLMQALLGRLQGRGFRVAVVRCLRSDPVGVFAPWRTPLTDLLGDRASSVFGEVASRLGLSEERAERVRESLVEGGQAADRESDSDRELLPMFLAEVFRSVAASDGRLALAVDDWQWLDGPGRKVVEILQEGSRGLQLITARRGDAGPGETAVAAMNREEIRVFLGQCAGGMNVTRDLSREVMSLSAGLPLVAREIFVALRATDGLRVVGETVDLAPGAYERLKSRGSSLSGRLHEVPKEMRDFLACCAVWGDAFSREQVDWIVESCRLECPTRELWKSPLLGEFLVPSGNRKGFFCFYHDLLREASRKLFDDERRKEAHGAAYRWLNMREEGAAGIKSLAYHAREAGLRREAVSLYDELSETALSSFALREAIEATELADGLKDGASMPDDPLRLARRAQVAGEAAFHMGSLETAIVRLEEALVRYGVLDANRSFHLGAKAASRQLWMLFSGRPRQRTSQDKDLLQPARAALLLGEIAYFQDQREKSARWCLLALDLAARAGESPFLASLCAALACPLSGRRPRWVADRYRRIGETMVRRLGDRDQLAYVHHVSNLADLGRLRWTQCRSESGKAVDHWLKQGHGRREEEARVFQFYACYFQGDLTAAGEAAGMLRKRSRLRTDRQTQLWGAVVAALHALRCDGPRRARELLADCDDDGGDVMTLHAVNVVMGTIAWRDGTPWKALDYFLKADSFAQDAPPISPVQIQVLEAAVSLGEMLRWGPEGLVEEQSLSALWERAVRVARRFGSAYPFGRPLSMMASTLGRDLKDGMRIRRRASGAVALSERLGMPLESARIRCLEGLSRGDARRTREGLDGLEQLGASAEADHFRRLNDEG